MLIELGKGMTLHPGTFNAVITPDENTGHTMFRRSRPRRGSGPLPFSLRTLEVS